uniref:Uncharacterized protein n=1 Tax=Micrurus corallinus TaxID=54390 RepID=A0A2D4FPA0_MICCO
MSEEKKNCLVMAELKAPEPVEIENRIMELCHQFPHGITDQVIQNDMPHMEAQQRAMAINRLLSMGQLDLLRSSGGLLYRIKESQNATKMKGSDNQEKLVYQIIEDAGDKEQTFPEVPRTHLTVEFLLSYLLAVSLRGHGFLFNGGSLSALEAILTPETSTLPHSCAWEIRRGGF